MTGALAPGLRVRGFVLNTLLAEKMVDDRLRSYPHWLAARNLANEASDESVAALVEAVRGRYEIARRWYRLKAQLLGVDRLADYDRMVAVTDDDEAIAWADAKDMVLDSFGGFSPQLADTARAFFDEHRIDAPVRPGKRGGAFCSYTVPSAAPYVMLNYTARRRDVLTLAHELGHGVHAALARPQGVFHFATPLTLAETASVFGETLVFGRLLDAAPTPGSKLSLLAESIEGSIATVFRQIAMNRFEDLAHTARRGEGELSLDRIGDLWAQSQDEMLGDAVEVTEGYRTWWSYIPHFINTPGYVYAYAYGQLLALAVYGRYEEEGPDFAAGVPAAARGGRVDAARAARRDRRDRPGRPGILGARARPSSSASSRRPSRRRATPGGSRPPRSRRARGASSRRRRPSSSASREPGAAERVEQRRQAGRRRPSAAGIVAPSKSEPSATHAGPATCATWAACSAISERRVGVVLAVGPRGSRRRS